MGSPTVEIANFTVSDTRMKSNKTEKDARDSKELVPMNTETTSTFHSSTIFTMCPSPLQSTQSGVRSGVYYPHSPYSVASCGSRSYPASPASLPTISSPRLTHTQIRGIPTSSDQSALDRISSQLFSQAPQSPLTMPERPKTAIDKRSFPRDRSSLHRPFRSISCSFSLPGTSRNPTPSTSLSASPSQTKSGISSPESHSPSVNKTRLSLLKTNALLSHLQVQADAVNNNTVSPTTNTLSDLLASSPLDVDKKSMPSAASPLNLGEQLMIKQPTISPLDQPNDPSPLVSWTSARPSLGGSITAQSCMDTFNDDLLEDASMMSCMAYHGSSCASVQSDMETNASDVGSCQQNKDDKSDDLEPQVLQQQPLSAGSNLNNINTANTSKSPASTEEEKKSSLTFAQSYANLTSWTSNLTSSNLLPDPTEEALPLQFGISDTTLLSPCEQRNKPDLLPVLPAYNTQRLSVSPAATSDGSSTPDIATVVDGRIPGLSASTKETYRALPNKEQRFKRTADALHKSGLWEVAMKTGSLLRRNRELQRELDQFRSASLEFLRSVIKNPHNRAVIKSVLNNALQSSKSGLTSSSTVASISKSSLMTVAGSSKSNGSLMTVVVSAAAAAASMQLDSAGSSDAGTSMSGNVSDSSGRDSNFSDEAGSVGFFPPAAAVNKLTKDM